MNILKCPTCKGFYPCPGNWVEMIICAECSQSHLKCTYSSSGVGKSLLAEPVTLENIDMTKPYRNPFRRRK